MTTRYGPPARLIWSLQGGSVAAGQPGSSVIAGAGNSGNWPAPPLSTFAQNQMTPVDLRDASDVALLVAVGAVTSTPTLTVNLDVYDDQGNLFPAVLTSGAITTATTKAAYGGSHGGSGSYLILPAWGRVSWTCTGGTCTGVEIGLWAR